jgi:micrococcal nuclease
MVARLSVTGALIVVVLAMAMCATPAPTATPIPTATLPPTATPIPGERQEALVLRVVDGDTIVVELEGKRYSVRYIGIDTPETHHPIEGASYLGFEATDANRALVGEGEMVTLQRDISETDIYDRLLRYVWVDEVLINAELVRMGLARVRFYEPDMLYQAQIEAALAEAREAELGLHGPRPTPPAEKPLLRRGDAWTTDPSAKSVLLWYDPARGEPVMAFPVGAEVRVVDAFWVTEDQAWWYWIGIKEFNGWTTGEHIGREEPPTVVPGPPKPFKAYDWLSIVEEAVLYALPSAESGAGKELGAGTSVQVKRLSWEEATDVWWYYVESTEGGGWVQLERLGK